MSTVEDVRKAVQDHSAHLSAEELDQRLKSIIYPVFDFDEMSVRSLGPYWQKPALKNARSFVELFRRSLWRGII